MAIVTKPPALDESMNTTEQSPRNVADVLAQELSNIATSISGGSDKAPKTDIATVEPTNVASRAYNIGELVYVNGDLYKVITAISGGATFTVGTNIQSVNVSGALKDMREPSTIVTNVVIGSGSGYITFGYSFPKNLATATITKICVVGLPVQVTSLVCGVDTVSSPTNALVYGIINDSTMINQIRTSATIAEIQLTYS